MGVVEDCSSFVTDTTTSLRACSRSLLLIPSICPEMSTLTLADSVVVSLPWNSLFTSATMSLKVCSRVSLLTLSRPEISMLASVVVPWGFSEILKETRSDSSSGSSL